MLHSPVDPRRVRLLNHHIDGNGVVIYWMSRDQRVRHNWALLFARWKAAMLQQPLMVVFTLAPSFLGAPLRHYDVLFNGLQEVETELRALNIPFMVLQGEPSEELPRYAMHHNASMVVADYSPLHLTRCWKNQVAEALSVPLYEVDAHNIVPCRVASPKQEYAARTIRPKINKLLGEFLTPFPELEALPQPLTEPPVNWQKLRSHFHADASVAPVGWLTAGEAGAHATLQCFVQQKLNGYATQRNDPSLEATSRLSPYLHFGQISTQFVALQVKAAHAPQEDKDAFLEELIVRRELSDNYCHYNASYDRLSGIPAWAQETLARHATDPRDYIYSHEAFEQAKTHDPLWNAAQHELLQSGIIHGYMRMYWAKKILEWSRTPEEAFEIALWLNDRYALDGREPNGYVGVAWSIGGVHDRPWRERPVYGTIRYMNANGCARKFDVKRYIHNVTSRRPQQVGLF
uniref:Deoxyribodipyrimidine photo-lyase n=1 Tax=Chlorobium chlorochromatii (strain CaD3) TaxID=340177 RepID=Q3AS84_CHLCH